MKLTVSTVINKNIKTVWNSFNNPEHIVQWNFAHESWRCPASNNDLKVGGKFNHRIEAKDGSFGFNFEGEYTLVNEYNQMNYLLADDRMVSITFKEEGTQTIITEVFETENENPIELQQSGWQAILNNFKAYTEST